MRTLIRGSWVIGFQMGHHAILRDGVVVYEDDRILYVGPDYSGPVDRTIQAPGKLVAPGFVNIHALANLDVQTLVLDQPETGLIGGARYAVDGDGSPIFSPEQLAISTQASLGLLLRLGSTTIVEITTMAPARFEVDRAEVPALVEAAGALGARLYVSHKFRSGKRYRDAAGRARYHWDEAAGRAGLDYGREMVRRYEGTHSGRVRTMIFPYQFDATSPALLAAAKEAARELGVLIHLHTSQTLREFQACLLEYQRTPVQLLHEIGFLDPQTILTHLIYTTAHSAAGFANGDDSDLRIVADTGATVAHCPVVYARRDRLMASFNRYRRLGINVALGTDTFPQDIIEEMRWAALGGKWSDRDANQATAAQVYNAATVDAAHALGRDDLGRLAPGAKADILLVDLDQLHHGPVDDPIRTLVYAAKGTDVRTVIVDGRTVVEDGQVLGLDMAAQRSAAVMAHRAQKAWLAQQSPTGQSATQLFRPTYPTYSAAEWQTAAHHA